MNQFPSNGEFPTCPRCGARMVSVIATTQRGDVVHLVQSLRAISLFSKKSSTSQLALLACINCGLVTLQALQPGNLIPDDLS